MRLFRRLSTLRHGRGFGVHSPLAYELISSTLRDKPAYYADALTDNVLSSRRQRRIARIMLRLIARFEPATVCLSGKYLAISPFLGKKVRISEDGDAADIAMLQDEAARLCIRVGHPAEGHGPLILDNENDLKIVIYRKGLSPTLINTTL